MKDQPNSTPFSQLDPETVLEHATWLRSFARALVQDPADAEDIAQDALGVALTSTAPIRHPRGYLAVTARRLASGLRRERRHRKDREVRASESASHEAPPAEAALESMDTLRVCFEEIRELPKTQAHTLSLRYVEGLSVDEVAGRLGTRPSTVRSNLARGLSALRARLDERLGGREAWCATLIPMALPGHVPAASFPEAGRSAAAPSAASVPAAAFLVSAMNLKLAAAILTPVLLTAGLYQLQQERIEPVTSPSNDGAPDENPALVSIHFNDRAPDVKLASVEAPPTLQRADAQPTVSAAIRTAPEPTAAGHDLDILLRDLFSPEPLFAFEVNVTALDADRSELPINGQPTLKVATDAEGRVRIDRLPRGTTTVALEAVRHYRFGSALSLTPDEVSLDNPKDVYVGVGPTYRFDFDGAPEQLGGDWQIIASGPSIPAQMPITSTLRWLETPAGFQPWTRFTETFGRPGDDGPWTLELRTSDGLLTGSVQVPYDRGARAEPFRVPFETLGAIHFILDSPLDPSELEASMAIPQISLTQTGSGDRSRARLMPSGDLVESIHGRLTPGTYQWEAPGQVDAAGVAIAGTVEVRTGETATVHVPSLGGPFLERSIIVDARGATGTDFEAWSCTALDVKDIDSFTFLRSIEPAPDLGPGFWRIRVGSVPQEGWTVQLSVDEPYEVSPDYLQLRGDGAPDRFVVAASAPRATVEVTFHDATTGEPLEASTKPSLLVFERVGFRSIGRDGDGNLNPVSFPTNAPSRLLCRADGYQMTEATYEPGNGGRKLRVELLPGWRSRVYVMNLNTVRPQAGVKVIVDGKPFGETNEAGIVWLDLEGPPDLVELDVPEDLEVTLSPFRDGLLYSPDPEEGYGFVVGAPE